VLSQARRQACRDQGWDLEGSAQSRSAPALGRTVADDRQGRSGGSRSAARDVRAERGAEGLWAAPRHLGDSAAGREGSPSSGPDLRHAQASGGDADPAPRHRGRGAEGLKQQEGEDGRLEDDHGTTRSGTSKASLHRSG